MAGIGGSQELAGNYTFSPELAELHVKAEILCVRAETSVSQIRGSAIFGLCPPMIRQSSGLKPGELLTNADGGGR